MEIRQASFVLEVLITRAPEDKLNSDLERVLGESNHDVIDM